MPDDDIGEQLAGWGKVVRLETRGRVSGTLVGVAVGYLEQEDGSILVAAGDPDADWARNLEAEPRCRATIAGRTFDALAVRLEGSAAAHAVAGLILKYGTPAERLGRGPAFRLRPEPGPEQRDLEPPAG
ncbi:MAG: nitroreductase family deazaflavin-dependent oxidoreductase [Chloroflexota bacterium]